MKLVPADRFSLEQLTDAYNQTRVDYIVPMPQNVARLREYIQVYDIDLTASWVALDGSDIIGLGMLGVRPGRAWVSRLGVLPDKRRRGTGRDILDHLLESAAHRGLNKFWLEVIKGNEPARQLFLSAGFRPTRELLVLRRPPAPNSQPPASSNQLAVTTVNRQQALQLLGCRRQLPNWINETESLAHTADLVAFHIRSPAAGQGWVCCQASKLQLSRIVVEVVEGDGPAVVTSLMHALHGHFPTHDAVLENLPAGDPKWSALQEVGYFEAFRRIEMVRPLY